MNETGIRLRTPAAILETAARVLADRSDASINDIAAAAGEPAGGGVQDRGRGAQAGAVLSHEIKCTPCETLMSRIQ